MPTIRPPSKTKPAMSGIRCPCCQNELTADEIRAIWSQMQSIRLKGKTSPLKKATAAANGAAGGAECHRRGGRPKGSKNKPKTEESKTE